MKDIEIEGCTGRYNYYGMVNNITNKPNGFGRARETEDFWFYDGQFLDGKMHGFIRFIR